MRNYGFGAYAGKPCKAKDDLPDILNAQGVAKDDRALHPQCQGEAKDDLPDILNAQGEGVANGGGENPGWAGLW